MIKPRKADSHKGNFGHSLIVAGNKGSMGAAIIAARACLRSGTGLLTVNVPLQERAILQTAVPEAMLMMRASHNVVQKYAVIGIGPGLGTGKQALTLLTDMITHFEKPMVLDADALNLLSTNKPLFDKVKEDCILTPHPKEFDRLFGIHQTNMQRMDTAIKQAKEHQLVIVLKGHHTLVTNGNESFLNKTGNAGLAKGGSGDALTGVITALLAQGYKSFDAARMGVYLHGAAADIALTRQSMESMLITDVIECLGDAFKAVLK